jgi:Na+/H+-dicarboxylate symporter
MKKIPLHIKILLALALGTIFGIIFHVDHHTIVVKSRIDGKTVKTEISGWNSAIYLSAGDTLKVFDANEQPGIVNYFHSIKDKTQKVNLQIITDEEVIIFDNITSVLKPETAATMIKPIGTIFIRLLSFLAIPLVIATLIVGAASLNDVKRLGKIGFRTLALYITTTVIAITIGLGTANIIAPGTRVSEDAKMRLMADYDKSKVTLDGGETGIDIVDFFVNIVPKNPLNAIAEGRMLQIVFFAVFFGITITFINRKKAIPLLDFFEGVSEVMIKMVGFIMLIAPYGVFALIAATVADFGYSILSTLIWYMFAVIFALLLHTFVVYPLIVKIFGRMSPGRFFKGMRNAQAIGFSTSSSAATLPVTFDCVENKLKIPKEISGFVLPLGATINMDGTALYQGVAAIFIAQVYGIDLGLVGQLTIVITAVLASIGTAPVPGVGIIMLVLILQSVNIPPEGIALILGVDRILDMMRTVTNVTGDAAVTVAVAGMDNKKIAS